MNLLIQLQPILELHLLLQYNIEIVLKDTKGKKVFEDSLTAYAGYANFEYLLTPESKLSVSEKYTLTATINPIGDKKNFLDKNTLILNLTKL